MSVVPWAVVEAVSVVLVTAGTTWTETEYSVEAVE